MIQVITEQWASGFWGKLYVLFALISIGTMLLYFIPSIFNNPLTRLKFIKKAQEDGRVAVGKLSCWSLHGNGKPEYDQTEYTYYVDGKRYFVTYKRGISENEQGEDMQTINPDKIALTIPFALILYYDKKHPEKVLSKLEVFASDDAYKQVHTPKQNVYRDLEKVWSDPVRLVRY